jgi:fructokinase
VIAVFGEALMDLVDDGIKAAHPGGGPFNTARALARLGVPTTFIGRFSNDAFGQELTASLAADGVDLSMTSSGPEPTTIAVTKVDDNGVASYEFVVDGTSAPNLTTDMLPAVLPPEIHAMHVGTLGLLLEPIASTIARLVEQEAGRRLVMVDPNVRTALVPDGPHYRHRLAAVIARSTIVKASESDLAWLYPGMGYEAAADCILKETNVRLVVATLGARGAFGATSKSRIQVSAPKVDVVDTIGAGDVFGAGLLAWLHDRNRLDLDLNLDSQGLHAALTFACRVASIACTRAGADAPLRAEVT